MVSLPRLYPILDASIFRDAPSLCCTAQDLIAAGCTLLQYRNKSGNAQEIMEQARELKRMVGESVRLIMNDRADLCLAAGFDGIHVGQEDLSPEAARKIIGSGRWLGVSTHNPEQFRGACKTSADYVAIGPVFATASKANPDPVVGLDGIRLVRRLTNKPLVAIGGINRANCREVLDAGADSVAVIADLAKSPRNSAGEFLRILG